MKPKYKPSAKGLAEIAGSAKMRSVCVGRAQAVAAKANALDPQGAYKAEAATVLVGRKNEPRAGARVQQTQPSRARNQALKQAIK